MPITDRPLHRIAWGTTTVALAATIATLSAPSASADLGPITVNECTGTSASTCGPASSIVVGHTYQIVSEANVYLISKPTVNFYDNGQCIASAPSPSTFGHAGIGYHTSVFWVPTTAGTHNLSVEQAFKTASTPVTVVAAPLGSTPAQPPSQPGCGGGIGSGSSNPLESGSVDLLPGSSGI
ncbi:hypothetical protein [Nocardia sp. NPDC059228]|uniref:hypothetical protein n=1 Tax=Nocardia sp. NPDC059228 TaxID=3346777 RepID=UPI0036A909A0